MPIVRLLSVDARAAARTRAELAALISAERPDVACVHGAPAGPRWRTACGALARESGLVVLGGGRLAGGTLLLSSLAVDVLASRDLPLDRTAAWRTRAGATLALLRRGSATLVLAGARLAGDASARQSQLGAVLGAVAEFALDGRPAVLCVAGADDTAERTLAQGRTAVATGMFADDAINVADGGERHGPLVCVELELPG